MATPYQERKIMDAPMNVGDEAYFEAAAAGKIGQLTPRVR